jgi:hypothetical protein
LAGSTDWSKVSTFSTGFLRLLILPEEIYPNNNEPFARDKRWHEACAYSVLTDLCSADKLVSSLIVIMILLQIGLGHVA